MLTWVPWACPPADKYSGEASARYELSQSDDEVDCGRVRSERKRTESHGTQVSMAAKAKLFAKAKLANTEKGWPDRTIL